jgi:hypothetical protein
VIDVTPADIVNVIRRNAGVVLQSRQKEYKDAGEHGALDLSASETLVRAAPFSFMPSLFSVGKRRPGFCPGWTSRFGVLHFNRKPSVFSGH